MKKLLLTFGYKDYVRAVFVADVVAFLYERGQKKLAKELTNRSNLAFHDIDKILKEYDKKEQHKETDKTTASYNSDFDYEKWQAIKFWTVIGWVLLIVFIGLIIYV